jgi:hypothetical protein
MSIITEGSISVTGVRFITIQEFKIDQCANSHATAVIAGIVEEEEAQNYYSGAHENERIEIKSQGRAMLFSGVLRNVRLRSQNNCAILTLELISLSYLLDISKENRTYQEIGKNISEIIRESMGGRGELYFHGTDKASEAMIVQYHETSWEFLLRMAAFCEEPVFANIGDSYPGITIGVRNSSNNTGRVTVSGAASGFVSTALAITGTRTGGNSIISTASAALQKGELVSSYQCAAKEAIVPVNFNKPTYVGKVVQGIVKAVDIDKIQVHITDIDNEYDGASNTWFPYSTAYSSTINEAGIYCMPLVGDPVRVFLPSEELKDAFAASSVTVRAVCGDPENKAFVSPYGMSVLFTKDGMRIAVEGGEVYINLFKDGGISLKSNKSIGILSQGNINTNAAEGHIALQSDKEISIGTENSRITLLKEKSERMYIAGPQIFIK